MPLMAPEWLTKRGGSITPSPSARKWFMVFDGRPQYALMPVPVGGQFGCAITQTINGRRVDSTRKAATEEDAVRAGLEDLRKDLGW